MPRHDAHSCHFAAYMLLFARYHVVLTGCEVYLMHSLSSAYFVLCSSVHFAFTEQQHIVLLKCQRAHWKMCMC